MPRYLPPSTDERIHLATSFFLHPLNGDHQCALVVCRAPGSGLIVILTAISPAGEQMTMNIFSSGQIYLKFSSYLSCGCKRREGISYAIVIPSRSMLISDKSTSAIHTRFRLPSRHTFIILSQWKYAIKLQYQNLISRLDDTIIVLLFPCGDVAWEMRSRRDALDVEHYDKVDLSRMDCVRTKSHGWTSSSIYLFIFPCSGITKELSKHV